MWVRAVVAVVVTLGVSVLSGCERGEELALAEECAQGRYVVAVDGSSSQRSPEHTAQMVSAVASSAGRAAVCERPRSGRVVPARVEVNLDPLT